MVMDFCDILQTYPDLQAVSIYSNDHFAKTLVHAAEIFGTDVHVMNCTFQGTKAKARSVVRYWDRMMNKHLNLN